MVSGLGHYLRVGYIERLLSASSFEFAKCDYGALALI